MGMPRDSLEIHEIRYMLVSGKIVFELYRCDLTKKKQKGAASRGY
jgi:hypothetical protein